MPFARLLKRASRHRGLLDNSEFLSRMYARRWHLISQNGDSISCGNGINGTLGHSYRRPVIERDRPGNCGEDISFWARFEVGNVRSLGK
jgi:hypothetical protein